MRGVPYDFLDTILGGEFLAQQGIFQAQRLLLLVHPQNALHGFADQAADHGEETQILLGGGAKGFRIDPVYGQGADGLLSGHDGHAEKGTALFAHRAAGAGPVEKERLIADLRHHNGLSAGHHPAGDALTQAVAATPFGLGADAVRHLYFQSAGGRVDDGDGAVLHVLPFGQGLHDLFQTFLQTGRGSELSGNFVQTAQIAEFLLLRGCGAIVCFPHCNPCPLVALSSLLTVFS